MTPRQRRHLFVGGLARSGTSALTQMLNGHSKIAIGMERYRYHATSGKLFQRGPKAFDFENFFTWRADEGRGRIKGGKYEKMYDELREKYCQVEYRGDKVPSYYGMCHNLIQHFPRTKIILIWRDIDDVAMSWQRRSEDTSTWPVHNDAGAAFENAAKALQTTLRMKQRFPTKIRLVNYDKLFSRGDKTPLKLAEWLRIDLRDAPFRQKIKAVRDKAVRLNQNREPVADTVRDAFQTSHQLRSLAAQMQELTV